MIFLSIMDMTREDLLATFYIYANVFSMIIFAILLIKTLTNKQTKTYYFAFVLFFLIIYFFGDSLWALAYFKIVDSEILLRISRMIYYSASGVIAYSWLIYAEILLDSPLAFNIKKKRLVFLPVILSTISTILICAFLDPAQKNIYGYLTAFALVFVPFLYIISAGIHIIVKLTRERNDIEKKKYMRYGIWPIVILAVSVLQVFFSEIPIFCMGAVLIIVSLHIYNQDAFVYMDALTNVGNRNMLKRYFDDLKLKSGEHYIHMIDINRFKQINDTKGHLEGDKALIFTANMLKKVSLDHNSFIARYGGDEFIIISSDKDIDDVLKINEEIHELLKDSKDVLGYPITVSIGYAKIDSAESIDDAIEKADNMMYEEKKLYHKQK